MSDKKHEIVYYKYTDYQGVVKYDVGYKDQYGVLSAKHTPISKYEFLSNYSMDGSDSPVFADIIVSILDIIWEITTQVAQKLIRKNVLFEDLWLSNLYKAFAYDIGKITQMNTEDFAAFEQIFDDIAITNMDEFLNIIDIFNDEARFDSSDFIKLLVARMAIKGTIGNTATVNPDGSLKDPYANLGGTTGGGFDPNKHTK